MEKKQTGISKTIVMGKKKRKPGSGGPRPNSGRKPVLLEKRVQETLTAALQMVYNTEAPEEARIKFALELTTFERGKIFIAEHIFGKPGVSVDLTTGGESIVLPMLNNDPLE